MKTKALSFVIVLVIFISNGVFAEDPSMFPSKPINLIVPYGAGGTSDTVARKLAIVASEKLGQPIVVENKPGGGGVLGSTITSKASPDGYTLLITSCTPCIYAPLQRPVPYDSTKDFTYIIQVADFMFAFCVRSDSKFKTFKDFIEEARKNPQKLSYQSQGPKSAGNVQMDYIFAVEKVKVNHLPGKGSAEVIRQLLGGHVDGGITAGLWPQMKAGKMRALAIAGDVRNENFPDVPTFKELGYRKGIPFGCAVGILGPDGIHPKITKKIHDAFKAAVFDVSYKQLVEKMMEMEAYKDTETYTSQALKDYETVEKALKDLGFTK